MPFTRLQHAGAARLTTISTGIGAGDSTVTLVDATGWPDGSVGPFYAVIDPGSASEEKVLVTSLSASTLAGVARGQDGTGASPHAAGAPIQHIWTAAEADEANRTGVQTIGRVSAKGQMLAGTGVNAMDTVSPGAEGVPLIGHAAATTGVTFGQIASAGIAANVFDQSTITGGNGTQVKVPTNGITATQIATAAVNTAELVDNAVTKEKFANSAVDGTTIIGGSGTRLSVAGGGIGPSQLATLPTCRVLSAVDQAIPNNTPTAIAFENSSFDGSNMHNNVTQNGRITFHTQGVYVVGGAARFAQNNTGYRQLVIELNGTTNIVSSNDTTFVTTGSDVNVSTSWFFGPNDYIRLLVVQTSGGSLNVSTVSNWSPSLWAVFVSPF